MSDTSGSSIPIEITPDRLRAFLSVVHSAREELTLDLITARLTDLSIPVTSHVNTRIGVLIASLQEGEPAQDLFLLVEGVPPIDGAGARFEPLTHAAPATDDLSPTDFHLTHVAIARPGESIGALIPESPPVDGQDVFGKLIPAARTSHSIRLGRNVKLADDGRTVLATAAGQVHVGHDEVSVLDVVEVGGDVDFSTGDIDAPVEVRIRGTVRESFSVRSAVAVHVHGAIEAARVEAGTDVEVHGGITANAKGRVIAGGNIGARFCDAADLQAGGDVTILHEILGSRVYAAGRLEAAGGTVIGGYVYAREGARIKELGNDAEIRTCVAVGIDPAALVDAARVNGTVQKKQSLVNHVRSEIKPLMDHVRRLTPQQRERATELMFEADQMEADVNRQREEVAADLAARSPKSEAVLLVTGKIFPAVTLIFGDKMAVVTEARRGPIRFLRRDVDGEEQIVMIDEISGSSRVLPSSPSLKTAFWNRSVEDYAHEAGEQAMGSGSAATEP